MEISLTAAPRESLRSGGRGAGVGAKGERSWYLDDAPKVGQLAPGLVNEAAAPLPKVPWPNVGEVTVPAAGLLNDGTEKLKTEAIKINKYYLYLLQVKC